jgi:hypothetical protein
MIPPPPQKKPSFYPPIYKSFNNYNLQVNAREKFVILSQIHPQIQRELKLFFF